MLNIGIDIGGTKIAGGVVDPEGTIVDRLRVDTPVDVDELAEAVVRMAEELRGRHPIVGIGVAAAGFVDRERTTVVYAPNIAWRDAPLRRVFEARLDAPVTIENDANAAGWAEFRFGAAQGFSDMVMLTMGTGVGGAVVANGALYRGGRGAAAELGHVRFVRDGLPCGCGQNGCLEQYASGRALQRAAAEVAERRDIGGALAAARGADGVIHGAEVSRLVRAGDPGALEALRTVATALGEGCGGLQAVLDPEVFVIGGGVAELGDVLLAPVREAYRRSTPGYTGGPAARIEIARLGNDAGVIGVADLAGEDARSRRPELAERSV